MPVPSHILIWSDRIFDTDETNTSGLYYKPITIVNDDSSVINKLETSLTDYARVAIYDCHLFIVQASELFYSGK